MLKRIADRLVAVYALLWFLLAVMIPAAIRRHNADWYAGFGYCVGLGLSVIIIGLVVIFQ